MNRDRNHNEKAAHWAVWGIVAVLCGTLFFQANRASSSRALRTDIPSHSSQNDVRAGAGTSAVDTLLW
jgi:hypothetical protein